MMETVNLARGMDNALWRIKFIQTKMSIQQNAIKFQASVPELDYKPLFYEFIDKC